MAVPGGWREPFWFARPEQIEGQGWDLRPATYRLGEDTEGDFSSPAAVLRDLLEEEESFVRDLRVMIQQVEEYE